VSAPDDAVRGVLDEHGDDGTTPRHTLFYFYDGDIEGLTRAAQAAGYTANPTAKQPGVILERHMPVDEDSFDPVVERMEDWADEFGCTFDGWECQLLVN
jgi:hypothetical protein